ncbi:MAG: hypothetical protein SFX74_03595 [Fimbriimonadaceae bacterium]|nr:hypothetical protein [Fimbriimonadaceae bacterium]
MKRLIILLACCVIVILFGLWLFVTYHTRNVAYVFVLNDLPENVLVSSKTCGDCGGKIAPGKRNPSPMFLHHASSENLEMKVLSSGKRYAMSFHKVVQLATPIKRSQILVRASQFRDHGTLQASPINARSTTRQ